MYCYTNTSIRVCTDLLWGIRGGVYLCFWDRCLEVVWKLELEYLDNTLWDPGWEDGPY